MRKSKTVYDVRGYAVNCINYQKCPLCYGCRSFNSNDKDCLICLEDKKKNICKTDLHRADLISKMITKESINFNNRIEF